MEAASCSGSQDKASPFQDEESSKDAETPAPVNGKRRSWSGGEAKEVEDREEEGKCNDEEPKKRRRRKRNADTPPEGSDGKVVVVVDKAQRKSHRINKTHSEQSTVSVKEIIRLRK